MSTTDWDTVLVTIVLIYFMNSDRKTSLKSKKLLNNCFKQLQASDKAFPSAPLVSKLCGSNKISQILKVFFISQCAIKRANCVPWCKKNFRRIP